MNPILKNVLQKHGYSVTLPRQTVFEIVQKYGPLTTAALASKCENIDRATAYRTIALFEKLGIITRIWQGFKSQIELSEMFLPHHHHATCIGCGKVFAITSLELEQMLKDIAAAKGFRIKGHSIELTVECKNCCKK